MIVARLTRKIAASDGRPFLAGPALMDIKPGTVLVLKKAGEHAYDLFELGARQINTDPQTLLTFMDVET